MAAERGSMVHSQLPDGNSVHATSSIYHYGSRSYSLAKDIRDKTCERSYIRKDKAAVQKKAARQRGLEEESPQVEKRPRCKAKKKN